MGRKKLVVELKAEALVAEIARVLRKLPYPCHASRHLEKSGNAVYFNLGEGVAAFKPKVKAAKYDITRCEASEVMKATRALVLQGRLTPEDVALIDDLADYMIGAMTNMIKKPRGPHVIARARTPAPESVPATVPAPAPAPATAP